MTCKNCQKGQLSYVTDFASMTTITCTSCGHSEAQLIIDRAKD